MAKKKKRLLVKAPTNRKPKLYDLGLMRPYGFLKRTQSSYAEFFRLRQEPDRGESMYSVSRKADRVSMSLKLVLKRTRSVDLSLTWSNAIWDIIQQNVPGMPPNIDIVSVRGFERIDDRQAIKALKRGNFMDGVISQLRRKGRSQTENEKIDQRSRISKAIEAGDAMFQYMAELHVAADNIYDLETAIELIKNYFKANDEFRNLSFEVDIDYQNKPLLSFGPDDASKNSHLYSRMPSLDAARSGLVVESGGDARDGSDFIGLSMGRYIYSAAAYPLKNRKALLLGDNENDTSSYLSADRYHFTEYLDDYQEYMSKVISRTYLSDGHRVVNFVFNRKRGRDIAKNLDIFPLSDSKRSFVDASDGQLNILEPIFPNHENMTTKELITFFSNHVTHIIQLLAQFRKEDENEDVIRGIGPFSDAAREVLVDFFVSKKYYPERPDDPDADFRLFVQHDSFSSLDSLAQFLLTGQQLNKNKKLDDAYYELNTIVNKTILPTLPLLNAKTSDKIDDLLSSLYGTVDFSGTRLGNSVGDSPSTNMLALAYLNVVLSTLKSGDLLVFHGGSKIAAVLPMLMKILDNSDKRIDVLFVEQTQEDALTLGHMFDYDYDLILTSLYQNEVADFADAYAMSRAFVDRLVEQPATFAIKTKKQDFDYVRVYDIMDTGNY